MRAALLASVLPACYIPDPAAEFRFRIDRVLIQFPDKTVSMACTDLDSDQTFFHDADEVMHAASLMKLPVAIEVYRHADAGKLDLDAAIPIENRFESIVDGSPFRLTPEADSERGLYDRVGQTATIRELMRLMLVNGSNLASNLLLELVTPESVQATVTALGCTNTSIRRGVEDLAAYERELNNTTTARDMMQLMVSIWHATAASEASCEELLATLREHGFAEMIPARLKDATVSHLTGRLFRIHHDAAIVEAEDASPYALVIMTKGFDEYLDSALVGSQLTRIFHTRDW